MSVDELERELIRWRKGEPPGPVQNDLRPNEALEFRNAGNVPDERGRTLRLVLHVTSQEELAALDEKRRKLGARLPRGSVVAS